MPLTKLKQRGRITIPAEIRERLSLVDGDSLEATIEDGRIVLTPKEEAVERHPAIDAAIEEGLADLRAGRTYGPFGSVEEMKEYFDKHPLDET